MPQQICPNCQTNNSLENRYCGNCGTSLTRYAMVPSHPILPVPASNRWQSLAQAPLVQAATVSFGALILRSALAWLLRRNQRRFSNRPAVLENFPLWGETQQPFTPRRSRPSRVITLAWWSVRVEEPVFGFEDELEPPK